MWFIPPLLASNPVRSQGLGDNNSYIYNKPKTPKEKQEPATRGTLATPCRPEPEHISMRGRLQCAAHQSTNRQVHRPKTLPEAKAKEHIQPQTNQCTTQKGGGRDANLYDLRVIITLFGSNLMQITLLRFFDDLLRFLRACWLGPLIHIIPYNVYLNYGYKCPLKKLIVA